MAAIALQGCALEQAGMDRASVRDVAQYLPIQQPQAGNADHGVEGWRVFNDAELNQLLNLAFEHNPSLGVARQRLIQAHALARKQGSDQYLDLDFSTGLARHFRSDSDEENNASIGLVARYELDLWGLVDALTTAAELDALATQMELDTAAISLTAEIASTWFNFVEQQGQQALIREQLQTNQTMLALLERRFVLGKVFSADVLRQKSLITQTQQSLNAVSASIASFRHRLAVLIGQLPLEDPPMAGLSHTPLVLPRNLPEAPAIPDTASLVSQLILQRPDIRKAFAEVEAADQRLAAAIAARYPRLDLSFSISNAADSVSDLFRDWLASIAADIALPLIDGGSRRADVALSASQRVEKWLLYQHAILLAVEEIQTTLSDARYQSKKLALLREQQALSDSIVNQLQLRYQQGGVSFLEVLSALEQQQQTERSLLTAKLNLLLNRVTLNRVLATGWQKRPSNRLDEASQTLSNED